MKEKKKEKKKNPATTIITRKTKICLIKMIKDPLSFCHFIVYGKHAVYFELLKCFIDIPLIKIVWRIRF